MKPMLSGQSIMHINCGKWQGSTTCTQETCSEQVSIFIQINKRDVGVDVLTVTNNGWKTETASVSWRELNTIAPGRVRAAASL